MTNVDQSHWSSCAVVDRGLASDGCVIEWKDMGSGQGEHRLDAVSHSSVDRVGSTMCIIRRWVWCVSHVPNLSVRVLNL